MGDCSSLLLWYSGKPKDQNWCKDISSTKSMTLLRNSRSNNLLWTNNCNFTYWTLKNIGYYSYFLLRTSCWTRYGLFCKNHECWVGSNTTPLPFFLWRFMIHNHWVCSKMFWSMAFSMYLVAEFRICFKNVIPRNI